MKVSVIGTGYVGLVSGTCFADMGHDVTCIDIDSSKIESLKGGVSPIYETGLNDMLARNIRLGRLHFSTGYESIKDSKVIFLAVGTPSGDDGSANLSFLEEAAKSVAKELSEGSLIVIKSTVPVGTSIKIRRLVEETTSKDFYLVNNPEFLKEGSAIHDFMRPDRVVIGFREPEAAEIMEDLYEPLVRQGNPIYKMSNLSAEMAKYASNCFLATKISFINEIARLCDATGADIDEVRKGMCSDQRIGKKFFYPGLGYGGSCFPKDVKALLHLAQEKNVKLNIVDATEVVNEAQKTILFDKLIKRFEDLQGKTFAFWGVAFKPNTDDVREAPAIYMARKILKEGGKIHIYDPVAEENFLKAMGHHADIKAFKNKYDCISDVDALLLITEWTEFRTPDFNEIKGRLKQPVLFDGRNIFDLEKAIDHGLEYFSIGRAIR